MCSYRHLFVLEPSFLNPKPYLALTCACPNCDAYTMFARSPCFFSPCSLRMCVRATPYSRLHFPGNFTTGLADPSVGGPVFRPFGGLGRRLLDSPPPGPQPSPNLNPGFRHLSAGFSGSYWNPTWSFNLSLDWRTALGPLHESAVQGVQDQGACGE